MGGRLTSQGSAHGRFGRAIAQRNLWAAEVAAREMGSHLSLLDALDYVALVAEVRPEKLGPAAIRWHGRFELESAVLTLSESQLALSALAALGNGDRELLPLLRREIDAILVAAVEPPLPTGPSSGSSV